MNYDMSLDRKIQQEQAVQSSAESNLGDLLDKIVDSKFGLFQTFGSMARHPGDPPVYVFGSAVAAMGDLAKDETQFLEIRKSEIYAAGCGYTKESSCWSAVGEGIERYSSFCYDSRNFLFGKKQDLPGRSIDPQEMITYSADQYRNPTFPFRKARPDAKFSWASGISLVTGEPVWVPASLVWLSYEAKTPNENILQPVTSGFGAGRSAWHAIHSGLCEVVERDAFSSYWMLQAPAISLEVSFEESAPSWVELLRWPGFSVKAHLLPMDHNIPVVVAAVYPDSNLGFTIGASCHHSLDVAIEKAVIEALHTWNWAGALFRQDEPVPEKEAVESFEDHVKYYLDSEKTDALNFLDRGPIQKVQILQGEERFGKVMPPAHYKSRSQAILSELANVGIEPIFVNTTTDDIRELGFVCGRVIAPGLHPLNGGAAIYNGDTRRLFKVADVLGVPRELNLEPHPFP